MRKTSRDFALLLTVSALVLGLALAKQMRGEEVLEPPKAPELLLEEMLVERETPRPGYRFWTPEDIPAGAEVSNQKMGRRPLDDSDPEMRYLAQAYFDQGGCGRGPGLRCPEANAPLRVEGDRMAAYLERQYEQSLVEGYADTATIVSAIAGTGSDRGIAYIAGLLENPRDDRERGLAVSALQEAASSGAVDVALRVLDRTPATDEAVRATAILAVQINIEEGKLKRPDAVARLRTIEARSSSSDLEHSAARRALQKLDE